VIDPAATWSARREIGQISRFPIAARRVTAAPKINEAPVEAGDSSVFAKNGVKLWSLNANPPLIWASSAFQRLRC